MGITMTEYDGPSIDLVESEAEAAAFRQMEADQALDHQIVSRDTHAARLARMYPAIRAMWPMEKE